MSRNGSLCLKKIIFSYSPKRGEPQVRQFFATHLPDFKAKYPAVDIDIRPRMWPESAITGVYQDGSERAYNVNHLSSMGIWIRCHKLVNQGNDYDVPFNGNHVHLNRRSVQGTWNPWLWNAEVNGKSRTEPKKWDRKLSSPEWDYYVDKYSHQLKLEETAIQTRVRAKTQHHKEHTDEVARRWTEHVAPKLQSDVEHNLAKWKSDYKRGVKLAPVSFNEYKLFAVPNLEELGQDAVNSMRRKETEQLEMWWTKRKEQLKPPV